MEKTFQKKKKKKKPTKNDAINFFSFHVGCEDANQIQQGITIKVGLFFSCQHEIKCLSIS